MPFGKHRGELLEDLPRRYLEWLCSLEDLREPLKSAVEAERERHLFSQEQNRVVKQRLVDEVVEAGRRTLAKKYHPDTGGTHEQMREINACADWLRAQARGLE